MSKKIEYRGFFSRLMLSLFGLNQKMPRGQMTILALFDLTVFLLIWHFFFPSIIPRIENIFLELWILITEKGLLYEFGTTITMVSKAMFFSILIAGFISFSGKLVNFMRPVANVMKYFRFWSTLGFAPVLRVLVGTGDNFQMCLLMFGIVPFLVTGFNAVLLDVEKDKLYDYARTMGYPEWKTVYYVMVRNRLAKIYFAIRDNFAIAWLMAPAVEIANRDAGGMGAMLFDYTRYLQSGGGEDDPYAGSFAINIMFLAGGITADYLFKKLVLTIPEEREKAKVKNA